MAESLDVQRHLRPRSYLRIARPVATLAAIMLAFGGCSSSEPAAPEALGSGSPTASQPAELDAGRGGAADREDAPAVDRVHALRGQLVAHVRGYAASLTVAKPASAPPRAPSEPATIPADPGAPSTAAYLYELRAHLSHETVAALDAATSSEAVIAVRRAEIEATLEVIHAYERTFGTDARALTTEWNVLPDTDLQALRTRARSDLVALEREAHRYADAERPPQLEHRLDELKRWGRSLEAEAAARGHGQPPEPRQIRPDVSIGKARQHPAIAAAEQRAHVFEGKLRVQVALRSHWAPRDAGLAALSRATSSAASDAARADSVLHRVAENMAARPPPLDRRALDVAEDVRAATWDELDATRLRDSVARARARARQRTGTEWLEAAHRGRTAPTRLSPHSSDALLALREEYAAWYRTLADEAAANPDSLQHHAEIVDARATIDEIDGELVRRHLPSRDTVLTPDDLVGAPIEPDRSAALNTLDRRHEAALAREEAVALEREANRPRPVPDPRLAREQASAAMRSLDAEAKALRDAWNELDELDRRILIEERGPDAVEHARQVAKARIALAEASEGVIADLAKLPGSEARVVRSARALLAPLRTRSAATARRSVAAALVEVEQLPARPPTAVSQPPTVAFFDDRGPQGRTPLDTLHPSGGAGAKPRMEYVSPPTSAAPRAAPESYSELFPEGEAWTRNHRGAIEPRRAPGGVVIDAELPDPVAHRIARAAIDQKTGAIRVLLDGAWVRFTPAIDAATARAAWAFVRDGRVPAADVRPLALPEVEWLAPLYAGAPLHELTASEQRTLRRDLRDLTSVNLNPGLVATAVGVDLMLADLVIFDLLPGSDIALEGDTDRYRIDVGLLWRAFRTDQAQQLIDPELRPFNKSLLVINEVSATVAGGALVVSATIEPSLFVMPLEGSRSEPRTMTQTTRWLTAHAGEIQARFPSWQRLARFAATTSLFRTIERRHVPNDLDVLIGVAAQPVATPRVFCRSTDARRCDRNRFAQRMGRDDSH